MDLCLVRLFMVLGIAKWRDSVLASEEYRRVLFCMMLVGVVVTKRRWITVRAGNRIYGKSRFNLPTQTTHRPLQPNSSLDSKRCFKTLVSWVKSPN